MTPVADGSAPVGDLSNAQWRLVSQIVKDAAPGGGRRPIHPRRLLLDGVLHFLDTECSWRQLPVQFPPWRTVYGYYRQWNAAGTLAQILAALSHGGE
jgi:transposase